MTATLLNYFLPKGKTKRIHVNQHLIRSGDPQPLTVKEYDKNTRASEVDICDDNGNVVATLLYRPDHPLSCGARVWIETKNEVRIR